MSSDLGLIPYTAKAYAHELASQRLSDASAQGGLPDARGANQAKDRPPHFLDQRQHRYVVEDALLDLPQAEVLRLEDARRMFNGEVVGRARGPRQRNDPVEV